MFFHPSCIRPRFFPNLAVRKASPSQECWDRVSARVPSSWRSSSCTCFQDCTAFLHMHSLPVGFSSINKPSFSSSSHKLLTLSSEGLWERRETLGSSSPVISEEQQVGFGKWGHWCCGTCCRDLRTDEWLMSMKQLAWKEVQEKFCCGIHLGNNLTPIENKKLLKTRLE